MQNTVELNSLSLENPEFTFITSNKNDFGFTVENPDDCIAPMEFIDKESGYLIVSFFNQNVGTRIFYTFDSNKKHISWNNRKKELEKHSIQEKINNEYTVKRTVEINIKTGQEIYKDILLKNDTQVDKNGYYFNGNENISIDTLYLDYLNNKESREQFQEEQDNYIKLYKII